MFGDGELPSHEQGAVACGFFSFWINKIKKDFIVDGCLNNVFIHRKFGYIGSGSFTNMSF